ncbi:MAG TPA: hypothetical protein VLT86_09425 [Vicinamibacterales bacterium]|nr:hypothetical protein [Vicinamibacterales bacterium]
MSTRTVLVALLGATLLAAPAAAQAQPASTAHPRGINAREHRQTVRIKDGVKDGQLTRGELDKVKADEAGIRAEERVYRKSGDGLDKAEVKDLEKDLNQSSRQIYRLKHNDRTRGGGK